MPEAPIPIQPVRNPILCSPYDEPNRHWLYDTRTGRPSEVPARREASYWFKTERTGPRRGRCSSPRRSATTCRLSTPCARTFGAGGPRVGATHRRRPGSCFALVAYRSVAPPVLLPTGGGRDHPLSPGDPGRGQAAEMADRACPARVRVAAGGAQPAARGVGDDGGAAPEARGLPQRAGPEPYSALRLQDGDRRRNDGGHDHAHRVGVLHRGTKPGDPRYPRRVLVVCPNLTIRERLSVLRPGDPGSYYEKFDIVPSAMRPELAKGKVLVTNWHRFNPEAEAITVGGVQVGRLGEETPEAFARAVSATSGTTSR